jgi:hypothetical protein
MNNLLDYSHMIKTYVMITNYDENENHYNDNDYCKCDHFIFCYNKQITKCKHYNIIIDNLPLFKIILNKNIKKQFKLPKKWNNSNITSNDLFKLIYYIINFLDEINDYYDNNHDYDINIRCIVSLSFYILIINNHNLIKNFKYLFKPLLLNSLNKLNFYLSDNISIDKFNSLFKEYFIEKPDKCINIMKNWVSMLDEII